MDYTYDLFGVSNHFGGMGGGHYTAYAYSSLKKQWVDYNDSSVRSANPQDIVSEAAYLLFYRRRDSKPCDMLQFKWFNLIKYIPISISYDDVSSVHSTSIADVHYHTSYV